MTPDAKVQFGCHFYEESCWVLYLEPFIHQTPTWLILCCLHVCAETSLAVKTSTLSLLSSLPCFIFLNTDSQKSYKFLYVSSLWNVSFMGTGALVGFVHAEYSVCATWWMVNIWWKNVAPTDTNNRKETGGRPDFIGMFPAQHWGKGSGQREDSCRSRKVGGLAEVLSDHGPKWAWPLEGQEDLGYIAS